MKIIVNKVKDKNYTQWIEDFVKSVVVYNAHIRYREIIIEDIEPDKRIFLLVNGEEYTIRTWDYQPINVDSNGRVCEEMVIYTLFKTVTDEHGSHGEVVIEGNLKIKWDNSLIED